MHEVITEKNNEECDDFRTLVLRLERLIKSKQLLIEDRTRLNHAVWRLAEYPAETKNKLETCGLSILQVPEILQMLLDELKIVSQREQYLDLYQK